jgi:hypothetical protein
MCSVSHDVAYVHIVYVVMIEHVIAHAVGETGVVSLGTGVDHADAYVVRLCEVGQARRLVEPNPSEVPQITWRWGLRPASAEASSAHEIACGHARNPFHVGVAHERLM